MNTHNQFLTEKRETEIQRAAKHIEMARLWEEARIQILIARELVRS